jgi:simple sugar transport system substrate-binding protein
MISWKRRWTNIVLLVSVFIWVTSCSREKPPEPPKAASPPAFTFGVVLVGPYNDHGWSEAHYAAGKYAESKIPNSKMIYVDNVNPGAKPGVTVPQVVDDLISKGDHAWKEGKAYKAPKNEGNFMGRMEYGKMMAGCAAALTTQTGKIGYLGPLTNDETRRLAASAYLGARYAWTQILKKDPRKLKFKVTWIGFWFNIPGQTLDPAKVAADFFNTGYDVVISGIDTTEGLIEANKMAKAGKKVWAVQYDYKEACQEAPDVCLGVPYFNWGPAYVKALKLVMDGKWAQYWDWNGPDWKEINNPDTSAVGFVKGNALSKENGEKLDAFIKGLADGSINLFKGPLQFQDGRLFLKEAEVATDLQIWYLPQLLKGMDGPKK